MHSSLGLSTTSASAFISFLSVPQRNKTAFLYEYDNYKGA